MHNAANHTASNYLMCEKRKCQLVVKPPFVSPFLLAPSTPPPSAYESWEEQAFARDSAGDLGGYVWPPRSYTCSFCRREFRSAQALGGHMNVHRRDRARLNQAASISLAGEANNYDPNPNANASFLSPEKEIYGELGRRRRIRDFFYDDDGDENDDDGISKKKMNTDLVFSLGGRQIDGSGEFVKSHDDEELKLSISPVIEELDLELRLGEKVK